MQKTEPLRVPSFAFVKCLFFGGSLAAGLCLYLLGESFGVR